MTRPDLPPITDEELARLERLHEEARQERHEEEESGEDNTTTARCDWMEAVEEAYPALIARLRAAERERDTLREQLEAAECSESSLVSARDLTIRDLRAQLAARDALLAECVAMLERCIGGKTDDGHDGGIYELTLSAECARTDDEGQRFFASKVGEIIKDARDLVRRAGEGRR